MTACACERTGDVSLPNVLHLICGDTITGKLNSGSGWLAKRLKEEKDDAKLAEELFLRAYSRKPSAEEKASVAALLKDKDAPRDELFRDLFWALLNSKEFLFNR